MTGADKSMPPTKRDNAGLFGQYVPMSGKSDARK
jgi:hypothetical protein